MATPSLDQGFGLTQIEEYLPRQQLIPKLGIETLAVSVFPWATRLDIERLHTDPSQPLAQGRRDELGAVVGTDMLRRAMMNEQFAQRVEYIAGVELAFDADGEAFASELINHTQHAEHLAVMGAVLNEVIGPDMALVPRPQPDAGAVIQPETASLWLFHWHFQPFTPPDAIHPLLVHMPAIPSQQGRDPAVAIPAEPFSQGDDGRCQRILVLAWHTRLALGGTVLADHAAGPALGCAECLHHMIDRFALA